MRSAAVVGAGSRAWVAWLPQLLCEANGQQCGLAIDLYAEISFLSVRVLIAGTRNSARRRSEASSAVSQSSKAGAEGTHLSKASLKPWRQLAVTITDCCP